MPLYTLIEKIQFSYTVDEGYLGAVFEHFKQRIENLKFVLGLRKENKNLEPEIFILCCCFIDAFANIFYSHEDGIESNVGARFRKILYDFGEFREISFNQVSLIEFERYLYEEKYRKFYELYYQHICNKIDRIDYSKMSESPKSDPLKDELLDELIKVKNLQGNDLEDLKDLIEKSTYASVLYDKYRNPVVHESLLIFHYHIGDENYVHYMGEIGNRAHLIIPAKYLVDLIEHVYNEIDNKIDISI